VGDHGGLGAVGGQSRDDLGRVGDVGPSVRASGGSEDGGSGEPHVDGFGYWEDVGRLMLCRG